MAGVTPVLSARSSLFIFRKSCLEHARTVQLTNDFWHHQLASFVGKGENNSSHITTSQTKCCMVLTRSMATNNNNGDEPCTTALKRQE